MGLSARLSKTYLLLALYVEDRDCPRVDSFEQLAPRGEDVVGGFSFHVGRCA
ncbi:hypothetical protein [Streptomyces phage phiScoe3]|nr:hypothetical protein [Streptomyces phage phiScoe3]